MAYSNSSRKGREFLRYLTDLSVHATLFAPNDSGLWENEVRAVFFFPFLVLITFFKQPLWVSVSQLNLK